MDQGSNRNIEVKINEKAAASALDALRPELAKQPGKSMRVAILQAVGRGLQAHAKAREDTPLFGDTFRDFGPVEIDHVRNGALALWWADVQYRRLMSKEAGVPAPPADLVDRCRELRVELLAAAEYVFRAEEKTMKLVTTIRRGKSHRDLADDLLALADLFAANWKSVEHRSDIVVADLNLAKEQGALLMNAVAIVNPKELKDWEILRRQAWAYFHEGYEELRAAARFVYRKDDAKLEYFPSLYAHPKKRS